MSLNEEVCFQREMSLEGRSWDHGGMIVTLHTQGLQTLAQVRAFVSGDGVAGQGSGLGLAIACEAAIRLGGEISLQDREDTQGLGFRFHLPLSNR